MSIGGTVSGYLGEALAEDLGYKETFFILAIMSAVPALVYMFFMPETLPEHVKLAAAAEGNNAPQNNIHSIKEEDEEHQTSHQDIESKAKYIEMY
jgi:predicted MFS family arabinose efflux permease